MKNYSAAAAAAKLKQAGVMPTRPRLEIARLLFAEPVHMTADQLIEQLEQGAAPVSRATVYNTLNLFCRKKLLRALHVDAERTVFDSSPVPHHHLLDVDSGRLIDLPPAALSQLGDEIGAAGFAMVDVIVRVRPLAGSH